MNSPSGDAHLDALERAVVAMRRSMNRRTLARLADPALSATDAQYDVLDALEAAEYDDRPATVSTLANALAIDQPRASRLVAATVGAGWVRRIADQADGRRTLLVRTAAGRAVTAEVHRHRRRVFAAAMRTWTDEEQERFADLLGRFVAGLPK